MIRQSRRTLESIQRRIRVVQAVLFDMGNVLLHFSHQRMCRQVSEISGCSAEQVRQLLLEKGLNHRLERGDITDLEFHSEFCRELECDVEMSELQRAASDIFELNQPIVPVLDRLRTARIRLVLLSNTSRAHVDFIQAHFDVLDRFDALALSYEVGAMKPENAIYEAAIEQAQADPEDCFYTDDIPEYIERGRSLGLDAEVFTGVERLTQHLAQRGLDV